MMSVQEETEQVTQMVCRLGDISTLLPGEDIYDAGLSSVAALSLLLDLEDTFNVSLPDQEMAACRTVTDITQMLARHR